MRKKSFLGDFHIHTLFSDGKHALPEIIDTYGKRGFGTIALTDHLSETEGVIGKFSSYLGKTLTAATLPIYREILNSEMKRAWDQYQMVVLCGLEFTRNSLSNHRSAHILGIWKELPKLFDEAWALSNPASQDIVAIAKMIKNTSGIAIAAHPVHTRKTEKQTYHLWDRREELKNHLDAWEVASGPYLFPEVLKSSLPKIASSDLHRLKQMRSWKTAFHCELKAEAILNQITKQQVSFHFYDAA